MYSAMKVCNANAFFVGLLILDGPPRTTIPTDTNKKATRWVAFFIYLLPLRAFILML